MKVYATLKATTLSWVDRLHRLTSSYQTNEQWQSLGEKSHNLYCFNVLVKMSSSQQNIMQYP